MKSSGYIVGIGASAGGLEAITDLFDNLPNNSGLTFIIVQHLSPDFKSIMDELLARHTQMPIKVIVEDTPVKPNHVYLISKEHNIIVKNGVLKPVERVDRRKVNMPIDEFFHSLGQEYRDRSIGVILSGTGSDGSRGLKAIKNNGGMILVQDPASAQFDGMPRAAIETNLVDKVLSPKEIAFSLVDMHRMFTSGLALLNTEDDRHEEEVEAIIDQLEIHTSINFRDYRRTTLLRRIEKRLFLLQLRSLDKYVKYLEDNPDEVRQLYRELLIGVTQFFRDPAAFQLLRDKVVPLLCEERPPEENLRIWVAGCSTGEEAYSIAIVFEEYLRRAGIRCDFKIFASDLDSYAIQTATKGLFPLSILEDIPPEYLSYFIKNEHNLTISKHIRERIVFTVHDALNDPPFINLDLISCRNLLIYLNNDVQYRLLSNFQFALRLGGFLFLGPSESLGEAKPAFEVINDHWKVYRNKLEGKLTPYKSVQRPSPRNSKAKYPANPYGAMTQPMRTRTENARLNDFLLRRYAPLCLFVNEALDIRLISGDGSSIFNYPSTPTDFNLEVLCGDAETIIFRNGVRKTLRNGKVNVYKNVPFRKGEEELRLNIKFIPVNSTGLIEENVLIEILIADDGQTPLETEKVEVVDGKDFEVERLRALETELLQVKDERQILIERLESTNEELQSSNEELMAANEELQSTNEELQSVNEELYTVNSELQGKINELNLANSDLNNLLNATQIGTIFVDNKLHIRKFTPAVQQQFRLVPSDVGRPITAFVSNFHDRDKDIYKDIKWVLDHGNPIEKEIRDNEDRRFLLRLLPYIYEKEGAITGVVISFVNIDELKQVALRRDVKRRLSILEGISRYGHHRILITDPDGVIKEVNANGNGFSREATIGRSLFEFTDPEQRPTLRQAIESIKNGAPYAEFSANMADPAGRPHYYDNLLYPLIKEGQTEELALVAWEVTPLREAHDRLEQLRKRLEKETTTRSEELAAKNRELEEINKYLDSFVNGAAHDLRAPMTQLRGYLGLMNEVSKPAERNILLEDMKSAVHRMGRTLDGLIELADFKKHSDSIIKELSIEKVYRGVMHELQPLLDKAGGQIRADIEPELSLIYIEPFLRSIFYNLIHNAIKYHAYDRPLIITFKAKLETNEQVRITVSDNGIGMDLNRYGHFLFQPFRRLTIERTGIGVGLSIINATVRRNGGHIEVESKLDKGSTFNVWLQPYEITPTN